LTTADWGTNVSGVATPGLGPREITATTASSAAVPKGVAANGKYIFCAASDSSGSGGGLYVFDGETYGQVGSIATDDDEQAVALSGGYAYLVDDNGEITEVDVGDLSSMSSGTYSVGAGVNLVDAAYANGYLYVAAGTNGFYSVKVADGIASASHTNNSTYAGGSANARGVAIYGRYLLVADNNGLYVFSLSDPANPLATGNITSIGNCYDVDFDGYFAFVASGDRINVVNLANPASPSLFTFSLTNGTCTSAAYNAGYVLGSCGTGGVEAYRFDYSTLKFSSTIALSGAGASAEGAVTLGKQTAVANGHGGGVAFVSNAHIFSPASEYDTLSLAYGSGETVDLVVNGKYAYATVQTYGLITIDLTTMAVVNIDAMSGASALGMALVGDRLLVAAGASGLYFFDITSPGNPSLDGAALSVGGGVVYDVVSDGKFAYLGMGGAYRGFARVDLFSRAYSRITTAYDVFDVELSGNWLSAACRDHGLAVFDIKEFDSGSPSVNYYTDFTSGSCWGSLIDNNYAYVALGDGGFSIVDISDPTTSLSTVGGLDYSTVGRIIGVGRYDSLVVLIRDATEPMLFVDVTNPASPTLESSSLLPEGSVLPEGIVQWNDYMLFADFFGGVKVWETYTQKNILPQSKLTSTKINGSVSGIKYFLWKSQEYFPEGAPGHTDNKDTVTFWTVFSDGTNKDSVKIFHSGVPDTTYYKYPEPLPWGADTAWEYIGYLANPVNDLRWKGTIQEAHEGWTVGGAWHACSLGIRFTTDDPPAARMRVSVRVHVNFGGGDVTELVIGLDSAATDRYDPGMDELYYPTGPGPHAYWAIDDPDMPEGAGLSTCWVSTRAAGRPIRLVLSDPAVLMWSIPPELDRGVLVLDGTDMAEATSISVSAGEYRALPGAGAEVYFRSKLSRGWNMVAPMAYPMVNSTADIFGVPVGNIWTYDDAYGGYYNSSAVGDGLGYFVLSTSDVS
ncbi:hypothetical protein J7L01_08200, partial [bacterium]|nr:hypothetical protein [bacterium]